jgi:hypothetical protein
MEGVYGGYAGFRQQNCYRLCHPAGLPWFATVERVAEKPWSQVFTTLLSATGGLSRSNGRS